MTKPPLLPTLAALLALSPAAAYAKAKAPETARVTVDPAACTPTPADRLVRLELRGAGVGTLVDEIAKLTCVDFVLDPGVVSKPVFVVGDFRSAELKDVLQTALRASGAALVAREHGYEVIAAVDMTRSTIPTLGPDDRLPDGASVVSKIVRIPKGHDGNALCNYLNVFKSSKGQIHPYNGEYLIITDFADSVRRLAGIMARITAGPAK